MADWLEVVCEWLNAWEGVMACVGAKEALEVMKAWYLDVSLAQLATFHLEAVLELELLREEFSIRTSALAKYTGDNVFILEWVENGTEVPPLCSGRTRTRGRTRRRRSPPAMKPGRRFRTRKVTTLHQMAERPAGLGPTWPQLASRQRPHRPPPRTRPRPTIRRPH